MYRDVQVLGKLSEKVTLYKKIAEFVRTRSAPPPGNIGITAHGAPRPGEKTHAERPLRARAPRGRRWGAAKMTYLPFTHREPRGKFALMHLDAKLAIALRPACCG